MKINISEEYQGKSVKDILKDVLKFPLSTITFLKSRDRGIVLNGERVTVRKTVKVGDILELEYTDDKTVAELSSITPVNIPLDIIYQDDDIIALNKLQRLFSVIGFKKSIRRFGKVYFKCIHYVFIIVTYQYIVHSYSPIMVADLII